MAERLMKCAPQSPDNEPRATGRVRSATDLASSQIDRMQDPSASSSEQANRKERLLVGPEEFRRLRRDKTG
jgi:hypothetical protein